MSSSISRASSLKDSRLETSSITSGIEPLTMSYHAKITKEEGDEASLTSVERKQVDNLPKSSFTTFVSPMERKRRMLQKQKEAAEGAEQPDEQWNAALEKYAGEQQATAPKRGSQASSRSATPQTSNEAASQDPAPAAPESDGEKAKRAAIQEVMQDASLTPLERNQAIQKIIKGELLEEFPEASDGAEPGLPPMDASSESSGGGTDSEEGSGAEDDDWASSSSYETDSNYTGSSEDVSRVSSRISQGAGERTTEPARAHAIAEEEEEYVLDGKKTRTEFRALVEKLVAQSMPDEVDNVDDIIAEYDGRERELLDTLAFQAAEASVERSVPLKESNLSAQAAIARASELEAQLDEELTNEAINEREHEARLQAQLDAELQNHAALEAEQQEREREFQAAAAERQVEKMQKDRDAELERRADWERERRRVQEEKEMEREAELQRLVGMTGEEERFNALAAENARSIEKEREEMAVQEELQRLAEEQRILQEEREKEDRKIQAEEESAQQRLQALKEEAELEEKRLEALREERERQRLDDERRERDRLREEVEREIIRRTIYEEKLRAEQPLREEQAVQTVGQEEVQAAQAVESKPRSAKASNDRSNSGSLLASQALSSRQGSRQGSPSRAVASRSSSTVASASPPMRSSRYDGVDDDELNWRLDCYASLSDYTIVVNRARPGPHAPDFDTTDASAIDFEADASGEPKSDVYYVHKAMIAVGSRRSELLGRNIRETERNNASEGDVYETVMLESAANTIPILLDFCYYHDQPLAITVENAVPLVYLAKRYKIRLLLEEAETFVMENLKSTTAMYFLLDSYLYQLDDILTRAIDVTAAHLEETVEFEPIYRLPPELFRRIILSKELKCESELLSLVVYSYCGEHHSEEIDVEYFRELTKPRIMPNIDPKVALMVLKYYTDLLCAEDENCDVMQVLHGDSLMNRCVAVTAKHWQPEVCEPLMIDAEWESGPASDARRHSQHEPAALHRTLPPPLQNYLLEKCILAAKNDVDSGKSKIDDYEGKKKAEFEDNAKNYGRVVKDLQVELKQAKAEQGKEADDVLGQVEELQTKAAQLEEELEEKTKALEEYKRELGYFRRVPGIHNFGEVSKDGSNIIDKTRCTYSANPDHHYPNHRRGKHRPTQMPKKAQEVDNLAKENGYLYDDGHGELLPVFYYQRKRSSREGGHVPGEHVPEL